MPDFGKQATSWGAYSPQETFKNQLLYNRPGGKGKNKYPNQGSRKWDGPYLMRFKSDPWGHKYICNIGDVRPGQSGPIWVISAGPDGILDTKPSRYELRNDDIGILLEG